MTVTGDEWGFQGDALVQELQVEASDPRLSGSE